MRAAVALLALALGTSACGQAPLPKDVQAVIDRSHNSRANYAVILKVEADYSGAHSSELNAEFQQGAMHRVEVPTRRVLANCDTGEGSVYDVPNARYIDDANSAKAACGIFMGGDPVTSAKMLPPVSGPYGRADRIELTSKSFTRHYSVTPDGIIVADDYIPNSSDVRFSTRTVGAIVKRGPQPAEMFTRESLVRAYASSTAGAE